MKFKLHKSKDKQFYFTIVARNGRVIATSETYKKKQSAEKAIVSIFKHVIEAQCRKEK